MIRIISAVTRWSVSLILTIALAIFSIGFTALGGIVITWLGVLALRLADVLSLGLVAAVGTELLKTYTKMWNATASRMGGYSTIFEDLVDEPVILEAETVADWRE